jgi:hypothetical protein
MVARIFVFISILTRIALCMAQDWDHEFHLERAPAYTTNHQLLELEASGHPKVLISIDESGALIVDASAVFQVNLDTLIQTSLDFDNYAEFKAPNIVKSRVIKVGEENHSIIIWNKMRYGIVTSSQYQFVITYKDPAVLGFAGSRWHLYHPENPQPDFPDSPIFYQFDGSWYIEPLEKNPDGKHLLTKVYVRYFLKIKYHWWLPSYIINYFSTETGALERDVLNFLIIFKRLSS